MKNFIILFLTVFILSCSTAPQILNNRFISSRPNLQVQFHKPIIEKSEKSQRYQHGDLKSYHFRANRREGVLIQIYTYIASRSGVYFYGPEQMLTSMGCMVLDPVVIDGDQWIKFVDVFGNKFLFTGYFRFMNETGISVGRIYDAGSYAAEIGSFRKGASLSYGQGKVYDEAFAHTDQLFSIGMATPDRKVADQPKEKPKVASIPKAVSGARVSLRKEPKKISDEIKIKKMLVAYGFFDFSKNPLGSFENVFVDNNDGTVTDKATGLMWQQSGSSTRLNNQRANIYIIRSNEEQFAGHSDWRMPTVEELASLLTRSTQGGIHLDPVFDDKQIRCWTIDESESQSWSWYTGAWLVDFQNGEVIKAYWWKGKPSYGSASLNPENYVKAVRSVK